MLGVNPVTAKERSLGTPKADRLASDDVMRLLTGTLFVVCVPAFLMFVTQVLGSDELLRARPLLPYGLSFALPLLAGCRVIAHWHSKRFGACSRGLLVGFALWGMCLSLMTGELVAANVNRWFFPAPSVVVSFNGIAHYQKAQGHGRGRTGAAYYVTPLEAALPTAFGQTIRVVRLTGWQYDELNAKTPVPMTLEVRPGFLGAPYAVTLTANGKVCTLRGHHC